jgi:demethylmenaquinone methyltransferase/2-methoxy-6-polyprenyl-1,4-benzoquinol methylase
MFDHLSCRYDRLNRIITFGFDQVWRRRVVRPAMLSPGSRLLDVGAGTGHIAVAASKIHPTVEVTAADFSLAMMKQGITRPGGRRVRWCAADALQLPFRNETFDAITSGYLIRNVVNPVRAFEEQLRVIKPGGCVVCLETSPPKKNLLQPLILFHLKVIIPFLGRLIGGNKAAYTYLPESTRGFMGPEQLAATMEKAGFESVGFNLLMFGTMAIHQGRRPYGNPHSSTDQPIKEPQ